MTRRVTFEPLGEATFGEAVGVARSFMDEEEAIEFARTHVAHPDLSLVCRDSEGSILGVCFGSVSPTSHATLRMISMKAEDAGQGFGSQLLRRFEESCAERGCASIGMGSSSEEYVERFYLKNGYTPVECWISFTQEPPPAALVGLGIRRPRHVGNQFFVNVTARRYDIEYKKHLKEKLRASEVGFVFRKTLEPVR
jgi:GNAT superfamily N-acetyltransferase